MKNNITKINLSTNQKDSFENIIKQIEDIVKINMPWDNMISLSGAAGTGKTFLITHIIKYLQEKYSITVTAPTHKAVKVIRDNFEKNNIKSIELKTIHSFLNIKLFTDYVNGSQIFKPDKTKKDLSKTDILIIDESSMVSSELFEYIEETILQDRVKVILFVGDYYQLLPVDSKKNKVFDIRHQYKLNEIVRQAKDSYIINIASQVRELIKNKNYVDLQSFFFKNKNLDIEFFSDENSFYENFYKNQNWDCEDKIITSYSNKSIDHHNNIIRRRYWQERGIYNPEVLRVGDKLILQDAYTKNNTTILQNNQEVVLTSAEKVYFEKIDIYYWICKNEQGVDFQIVDPLSLDKYNNILKTIANNAKQEKNYEQRTNLWKQFYRIKDFFVSVKYSFASTIHKLQGSTYETVYIDLLFLSRYNKIDNDELYRLIYVAITRASKDIKILIHSTQNEIEDIFAEYT